MQERIDTSVPEVPSAWDLFPSEQLDSRVPALREPRTPAVATAPHPGVTAPTTRPSLPRERESLQAWLTGTGGDLLMSFAIGLARLSNSASTVRLPGARKLTGEGLVVMTGTVLAAGVLVMTGSPSRVTAPEVLEAASSTRRVEIRPAIVDDPQVSATSEAAMTGAVSRSRRQSPAPLAPAPEGPAPKAFPLSAAASVSAGSATRAAVPAAKPLVPDAALSRRSTSPAPSQTTERPTGDPGPVAVPRQSVTPILASSIRTTSTVPDDLPAGPPPPSLPSTSAEIPVAPPVPPSSPAASVGSALAAGSVAAPVSVPSPRPRSAAVQGVLNRYRDAFNALDPAAAKAVWPSADTKGLGKAFGRLHEQEIVLETCNISVIGARAVASCDGTLRYVPNVGSRSARVQQGRWEFSLRETGDDWTIETVKTR